MEINFNSLIIRNSLIKEFIDHMLTFQKEAAQWNNKQTGYSMLFEMC
jgi:hypothetical protein